MRATAARSASPETLNTYAALWRGKADEVARKLQKRRPKELQKAAKKGNADRDQEAA